MIGWDEVCGEWNDASGLEGEDDKVNGVRELDGVRVTWGRFGRNMFYITAQGPREREFAQWWDVCLQVDDDEGSLDKIAQDVAGSFR